MWKQKFFDQEDGCNPNEEWEYEVGFKVVDDGIGSYEYWGIRSIHHDYKVEIVEDSAVRRKLRNGKPISDWEDYEPSSDQERGWIEGAEVPDMDCNED